MVTFKQVADLGWVAEWTNSSNHRQQATFLIEDGDWVVAQASDAVVSSHILSSAHREISDAWLNKIIMEP